jgi:methionyl-tRNA formyltransferase
VYTQPDRPSGRGNKVSFSPVKQLAIARNLAVFQPSKIKTDETLNMFLLHSADITVVVAYGRILPAGFLNAFHYGAFNVHFSLLPKYRGAAPVNWAIVNGEVETGVTVMQMDEGLDTGDILVQRSTEIGPKENAVELMDKLAVLGGDLIVEALANIDDLHPMKQDDSKASFAPIMKKEDGLIDWSMSAVDIERRVRGFQPFPTSYSFYDKIRLTIWVASLGPARAQITDPGTVIKADREALLIACGRGDTLSIREIQPEGKRRMAINDFLNGAKINVGDVLGQAAKDALKV